MLEHGCEAQHTALTVNTPNCRHACSGGHELFGKDGVTCKLRTKVIEANKISVRRLLSAPTCPVERSSHCSKRFSMVHPCSIFRTHWIGIIDRLHIDDSQTEALLTARTAALEQLRVIYEVRDPAKPAACLHRGPPQ